MVTGKFSSLYIAGERNFPASDDVWGNAWQETKKTFVVVFQLCDNYYTKIITEGQALVMPQ